MHEDFPAFLAEKVLELLVTTASMVFCLADRLMELAEATAIERGLLVGHGMQRRDSSWQFSRK
jgi:hypothetical protein